MDMHALLTDPHFWVLTSFIIFFAIFGKIIWKALTKALDSRANRIAGELEEARKLRQEAEVTLAAYRQKHAEALKEAESILAKARADAERLSANAQIELKQMLEARKAMAEGKIAQAERQAIAEVREHVADITIAAAKAVIVENIRQLPSDELMRKAIEDMGRKVH